MSEHEVRQLVFENTLDPEFPATCGHSFEDRTDVFDAQQTFLARRDVAIFRSGMDDEVVHSETGCCFDGAQDFRQGVFAASGFQRGDVDVVGERRVEGVGLHAKGIEACGGFLHALGVAVIEVLWREYHLDHAETARADRFETLDQRTLVKAAR